MSALGWLVRAVLISGSSTGLTPPVRAEVKRPSRRRTPGWLGALPPLDAADVAEFAATFSTTSGRSAGAPTAGVTPLPATGGLLSLLGPLPSWVTPLPALPAVATSPVTAAPSVR